MNGGLAGSKTWSTKRRCRHSRPRPSQSPTSFSARFTALAGEPVLQYLTRWRMQLARAHLQESAEPPKPCGCPLWLPIGTCVCRAFKSRTSRQMLSGVWPGVCSTSTITLPASTRWPCVNAANPKVTRSLLLSCRLVQPRALNTTLRNVLNQIFRNHTPRLVPWSLNPSVHALPMLMGTLSAGYYHRE